MEMSGIDHLHQISSKNAEVAREIRLKCLDSQNLLKLNTKRSLKSNKGKVSFQMTKILIYYA